MPSLSLADSSATESRPAGHTWLNALQQGDCMHLIYATINNSAWECACTSLLAQWMMLRGSLPIMAVPCWHVKCVCGTLSSCSANIFAAFTCQGMAAPEPHAGRPRHATSSACALMYRERRHFWCGKERMQACRRAPWRCPWFKEGSAAQYRARAPRVCRSGLPGSCKTARLWPAPNAGASGCGRRAAPGEGPHPAAQRRAPLRMSAFG